MYRYDSRYPMEFRSDAGAENSVKSWQSNDGVISRNSVARASGAREMVRQKPLFQRLGPDLAPASGLHPKHFPYFVDKIHPPKTCHSCKPVV